MADKTTGGGKFNPEDRGKYFIACVKNFIDLVADYGGDLLVAVNEIASETDKAVVVAAAKRATLFLDSGVYNLASTFARNKGISHDEGLKTPLSQIDGFPALFDKYVALAKELEPDLWGYIELDIGGTEQKRVTRAKLEGLGLRPIPVYHALNDPLDYFDELAGTYDRICVGSLVAATSDERRTILQSVWQRRQKYPGLRWVHLLGVSPSPTIYAYPPESLDSSSWNSAVRYGSFNVQCMGDTIGQLPEGYHPIGTKQTDEQSGYLKAVRLCAYNSILSNRALALHEEALR